MAKRILKCLYCGEQFDANEVEFTQINSRRYAHKKCYEKNQEQIKKIEKDKKALDEYIKNLFGYDSIPTRVRKQIKDYTTIDKYTYSGILKTLKYFYEVKGNTTEKANGGIGIVEYIYRDAEKYWRSIWEAQELNKKKTREEVAIPTKEIRIKPPIREPMRRFKERFTFIKEDLDE